MEYFDIHIYILKSITNMHLPELYISLHFVILHKRKKKEKNSKILNLRKKQLFLILQSFNKCRP